MEKILLILLCFSICNNALCSNSYLAGLIQEVLDNNNDLKKLKFNALSIKGKIIPIESYQDPKLQFEVSNLPKDTLRSNVYPMSGKEIRFTQKINFPGKLTKLGKSKRFEYLASREQYNDFQSKLIMEVKNLYFNYYLLNQKIKFNEENKQFLVDFIKVAEKKYSTGKGSQLEIIKGKIESSEIEKKIIILNREMAKVVASLNSLREKAPYTKIKTPLKVKLTNFNSSKFSQKEMFHRAVKFRPKAKEKLFNLKGAQEFKNYTNWSYLPDFEFGIKYRMRSPNLSDDGTDFASAYIGINIPFFNFSKQNEKINSAIALESSARINELSFHRILQEEIYNCMIDINENIKIVELYSKSLVPSAKQALKLSEISYKLGKVTLMELIQSEKLLIKYKINLEEARVNYESAIVKLEQTLGIPISNWNK